MTAGSVCAPLIIPIMHQLEARRAKNHIYTNTPVSVQSDSPNVNIFYTLDGSRPIVGRSLMKRSMEGGGSSHRYSEPIRLPAGRVSVRAVAVSSDGRESSVVTKVFFVDLVDSNGRKQTDHNVLQSEQQNAEGSSVKPSTAYVDSVPEHLAGSNAGRVTSDVKVHLSRSPQHSDVQSHDHLHPEQGIIGNVSVHRDPRFQTSRSPTISAKFGALNTSQIKKESMSLRCSQCHSVRPSDPFARFCSHCGAVVPPPPEQRLPPAEAGQVLCVFCNSVVPINARTCLICDATVQSEARPKLQDHIICTSCGSGNPGHMTTCLTCESHLKEPEVCVSNSAPSVPSALSRVLSCSRCKRLNHSDARFCDWCGCKPTHSSSCVMCWRCGASGHPHALYCANCGVYLEATAPPPTGIDTTQLINGADPLQATPSPDHTPSLKVTPPTTHQSTQTTGLFYPSATELHRKKQQWELILSRQQAGRDGQPPRCAISPGRGYWRKQLDHICAHLRSYSQNNAPFRTLLGEPRLGRLVSAVIEDDGCEVTLTVSFASVATKHHKVQPDDDDAEPTSSSFGGPAGGVPPAGWMGSLSSITERFSDSSLSNNAGIDQTTSMKHHKRNLTPKPAVKDIQLMKELAPGRGDVSVVQQLLDQGADPSCCNNDGRHALAVAVASGHHDVLPVLLQRGADVDQQSGRMKNTALHEAAARGSEGLHCAQVLLSCRASVKRRNASGQTAYDVALSSGCNDMASLLMAQTGRHLLDKVRTPELTLDIF